MSEIKRVWSSKKTTWNNKEQVWEKDWELKTYDWEWKDVDGDIQVYEGSQFETLPWEAELDTYDSNSPEFIGTVEDWIEAAYIFKDWDWTVLKSWKVKDGWTPVPPANPSREHYDFTGWSPEVWPIYKSTEYIAQYELNTTIYLIEGSSVTTAPIGSYLTVTVHSDYPAQYITQPDFAKVVDYQEVSANAYRFKLITTYADTGNWTLTNGVDTLEVALEGTVDTAIWYYPFNMDKYDHSGNENNLVSGVWQGQSWADITISGGYGEFTWWGTIGLSTAVPFMSCWYRTKDVGTQIFNMANFWDVQYNIQHGSATYTNKVAVFPTAWWSTHEVTDWMSLGKKWHHIAMWYDTTTSTFKVAKDGVVVNLYTGNLYNYGNNFALCNAREQIASGNFYVSQLILDNNIWDDQAVIDYYNKTKNSYPEPTYTVTIESNDSNKGSVSVGSVTASEWDTITVNGSTIVIWDTAVDAFPESWNFFFTWSPDISATISDDVTITAYFETEWVTPSLTFDFGTIAANTYHKQEISVPWYNVASVNITGTTWANPTYWAWIWMAISDDDGTFSAASSSRWLGSYLQNGNNDSYNLEYKNTPNWVTSFASASSLWYAYNPTSVDITVDDTNVRYIYWQDDSTYTLSNYSYDIEPLFELNDLNVFIRWDNTSFDSVQVVVTYTALPQWTEITSVDTLSLSISEGATGLIEFHYTPSDATDFSNITAVSDDTSVATTSFYGYSSWEAHFQISWVAAWSATVTISDGTNDYSVPVTVTAPTPSYTFTNSIQESNNHVYCFSNGTQGSPVVIAYEDNGTVAVQTDWVFADSSYNVEIDPWQYQNAWEYVFWSLDPVQLTRLMTYQAFDQTTWDALEDLYNSPDTTTCGDAQSALVDFLGWI